MRIVKNLDNLLNLLPVARGEVIIFPVGAEGRQLLDFLRYTNLLHHVCCIAAAEVLWGVDQKFINEVPVIPFENLVHFRETALLVVSVPENFQTGIDAELARLGFQSVVFVSNEIHAQIKNELQKMYSTGQVMMWYLEHFDEKIAEIEYRIAEQNEVSKVNTKAFEEYRNAFRGKEIVIVGNGPSLNYYKPIPSAIHIALNRAWLREDICFDYLFAIDAAAGEMGEIVISSGFDKVKSKCFIGTYPNRVSHSWEEYPEIIPPTGSTIARFYVNEGNYDSIQPMYKDICDHSLVDFGSVVSPAFHFALFTYPKRIYLAGCDTSPNGHFYAESKEREEMVNNNFINAMGPVVKVGYARTKMFAKQHYPDTEIISINPVGLRGLFKDVYTDEYKAALATQEK